MAVERSNTEITWRVQAEGAIRTPPCVRDKTLYVGSDDGHVYAVDLTSHAVRWKFQTGGAVRAAPILTEGKVVVASYDGNVYAIQE
jgi:outer membrane protein assembly factor BamB